MAKYNFKEKITLYDLEIDSEMAEANNEQITKCYNGAGAEWMPEWSRDTIDQFLALYKDCVAVHDWDFENSNGFEIKFHEANFRFKNNMKKVRDHYYPWSKPQYYLTCLKWYIKAQLAYNAVEKLGWKAWLDSYKK
ncbi:hypothetical protein AAEX28_03410 [Lentisphaerota bacterium WC36G]|nr:hypothetical protein LJT99_06285 [Lentisphaerae bacterium WC36]